MKISMKISTKKKKVNEVRDVQCVVRVLYALCVVCVVLVNFFYLFRINDGCSVSFSIHAPLSIKVKNSVDGLSCWWWRDNFVDIYSSNACSLDVV